MRRILFLSFVLLQVITVNYTDASYLKRCGPPPELTVLWSRELSHSLLVSTPLLTDVNADGQRDVVVTTFDGEIHVVDGSTGIPMPHSHWPVRIPHSTIHASPLQQMDGDNDGMLDILVATSQGQVLLLDQYGDQIPGKRYQIDGLPILKEWYLKEDHEDYSAAAKYVIVDNTTLAAMPRGDYLMVDPHVLATPVLADLNNDNQVEELIVPVSYYFDEDYYLSHPEFLENMGLHAVDLKDYVASCLLILNMTTVELIRLVPLELSKVESALPGYVLFSPTVIDLDSNHGNMEIAIGTSAGRLHVINWQGDTRPGFPIKMSESIHGQVIVDDVNMDGKLEVVAVDTSGNVYCYDSRGNSVWQSKLTTRAGSTGTRVADLDGDGQLELIIVTTDGYLFALSGINGNIQSGWPVRVNLAQHAPPLLTWLLGREAMTLAVLDDRGHLHLLTDGSSCKHTVAIRESSYVSLVSHQLISSKPGLQYIVATQDGTLLCLGQTTYSGDRGHNTEVGADSLALMAWPAESSSHNNLAYMPHQRGVVIHGISMSAVELSSSSFSLHFSVMHSDDGLQAPYVVKIYLGNEMVAEEIYEIGGSFSLMLRGPDHPTTGHLSVLCYNIHGHMTSHIIPVELHQSGVLSVRWVLVGPVMGMGVLLLLLHGYPEADLLPILHRAQ